MNNFERFNDVVDYIEQNLCGKLDVSILAGMMGMSAYEFRRIFSFAAGVPIGEYIRKRRMSLAAERLISGKHSVTGLAFALGYESSASFSRAFKEFHGASPESIRSGRSCANMFAKIGFTFGVSGGSSISYSVRDDEEFCIDGFCGRSDISDTECCENVWQEFYASENADDIIKSCKGRIYAAYRNGEAGVDCFIGARADTGQITVPASKWACFKLFGADDIKTNEFYEKILFDWLGSSSFARRDELPNLEIFPENMDGAFEWEIRIPVKKL